MLAEISGGSLAIAASPRRLHLTDWLLAGLVTGTVAAALAHWHLRTAHGGSREDEESTWAWPLALSDLLPAGSLNRINSQ